MSSQPVRAGDAGATVLADGAARTALDGARVKGDGTLLVLHPPPGHATRLRLISYEGLASIREATISIGGVPQISILNGAVVQPSGAPVALDAVEIPLAATFHERVGRSSRLALEIVTYGPDGVPTVVPWTLLLRA